VRKFIPFLRIWWFTHLNLKDFDLVISSSGAEAKGVKTGPNTLHVNYCHAPTHYYWSRYEEYMERPGFGVFDPLARIGLKLLAAPLRRWDLKASKRPDVMIANSTHIQSEIKKYYGRDSIVICPPVNTERFSKPENANLPRSGFLISGRQTPYKRFDLAVQACSELGLPLTVIGDGPDHPRLRRLAGEDVTFFGRVSDEELEKAFASASALIFPGLDDFGITPVEALASGTPVIAYRGGGALDYVIPGKTGEFFPERTVDSVKAALVIFKPETYESADARAKAQEFTPEIFREKFQKLIDEQFAMKTT
jgi:glycosyltransferase involved in cell wall biosynthesis